MIFVRQTHTSAMHRLFSLAAACVFAVALSGCGGSAPGASSSSSSGGSSSTTGSPTLTASLVDSSGNSATQVTASNPLTVVATLKGANGNVLANQVVSFTSTSTSISFSQASALTDATGVAKVQISAASSAASDAGTVTVTAAVGSTTLTALANFAVGGSSSSSTTTMNALAVTVPNAGLSAYGTAVVTTTVLVNGSAPSSPATVNFTQSCATGRASITSSATTNPDGSVSATFVDNGCGATQAQTVTVTASTGSVTKQVTFTVLSPTSGSINFVSVTPSDQSITLKGQGQQTGRSEVATVVFKVVDLAGNAVPNLPVCFGASTYSGGLTLDGYNDSLTVPSAQQGSAALCGSSNVLKLVKNTDSSGQVQVQVQSGTNPTPVTVTASTIYPSGSGNFLTTASSQLAISTGVPIQSHMDLSIDKANIEGRFISGTTATLTVRLADQFGNPVPDGTTVNFVSSGGAVCTSTSGACQTNNGVCSCTFTAQEFRPQDGRVVVLAYARGWEDYVDTNGNHVYDTGEPFTDLADAFVDSIKQGSYSATAANGELDIGIPFQNPANYVNGDGVWGNAHIRRSSIIYLSGDSTNGQPIARITGVSGDLTLNASAKTISFNHCDSSNAYNGAINFVLDDGYGNPMAAGTTLSIVGAVPSNISVVGYLPGSVPAFGARAPSASIDSPNLPTLFPQSTVTSSHQIVSSTHSLQISSVAGKCGASGTLQIGVTSPNGAQRAVYTVFDINRQNTSVGSLTISSPTSP